MAHMPPPPPHAPPPVGFFENATLQMLNSAIDELEGDLENLRHVPAIVIALITMLSTICCLLSMFACIVFVILPTYNVVKNYQRRKRAGVMLDGIEVTKSKEDATLIAGGGVSNGDA